MIRPGSPIKVTDNTPYHHDPQLALQTATAYFLIREIPSSTIPVLTTEESLLLRPTSDQSSINNGSQGLSKSVLEYIFLAIVVFIIICTIFRRFWRRQQPTFSPFASRRYQNFRRPVVVQTLHPEGQAYPAHPDPFLREIPAAYVHPPRRTRAHDIDSSGRRQERPTEMDHDGDLGANDTLPAYDNFGGPPKYFELDMLNRNRPPQSGITAQRPGASWENINITSPENVGVNSPAGTTRVSQHDASRPTPP